MSVSRRKLMCPGKKESCISTCSLKQTTIYHDLNGIMLLIFLYVLQGIPLGLSAAVPFLLQSDSHTVNYQYQAIFSWVFWPFSLKLAWAPFVDTLYSSRLGRRKTWLVPTQYALGIDLFVLSSQVDQWLGRETGHRWGPLGVTGGVQIWALTCAFFLLNLLAATQDIVVDGWALTMLSKENIGWASTCNTVGQTIGYMLGFIVFLALESPTVCNTYFPFATVPGQGLISFSGYLYFCAIVFIMSTTLVAFFKSEGNETQRSHRKRKYSNEPKSEQLQLDNAEVCEGEHQASSAELNGHFQMIDSELEAVEIRKDEVDEKELELSLWQTYVVMLQVLRLRPVLRYICFLFLIKFVFSAPDNVFGLKLLEHGVTKENLALIAALMMPIQAILPVLVTRWSHGPNALSIFIYASIPRAILAGLTVAFVYYTPYFRTPGDVEGTYVFSLTFYLLLTVKFAFYSIFQYTMFVCQMAYHARISDPTIGGTYMTLLNTAANLAGSLPATLMLFLIDPLTSRSCETANMEMAINMTRTTSTSFATPSLDSLKLAATEFLLRNATCKAGGGKEACLAVGGRCTTLVDGFYIEVGLGLSVGLMCFFTIFRPLARSLDSLPISSYRCRRNRSPAATDAQ